MGAVRNHTVEATGGVMTHMAEVGEGTSTAAVLRTSTAVVLKTNTAAVLRTSTAAVLKIRTAAVLKISTAAVVVTIMIESALGTIMTVVVTIHPSAAGIECEGDLHKMSPDSWILT